MLVIGLTGGIASGKSEVARRFAALGATIIDTDQLAREVLAPGSEGLAAVVREFGEDVLDADGSLDRRLMRRRIFEDAAARDALEAITHPRIKALLHERLAEATTPYVVVEIPLLIGPGLADLLDRILVIDCDDETRLRRLMQRDGENEDSARAALAAQGSRAERLARADDVIENDGSPADLDAAVGRLHSAYLALAGI